MKLFRYKSANSVLPAIHHVQKVVKHVLIVPSAFAIATVLFIGPDHIYDYMTDIDTAILYESIENSLNRSVINDTPSNQVVIQEQLADAKNQSAETKTETFNVIADAGHKETSVDLVDVTPKGNVTTALVAQHRLNELIERTNDPAYAQAVLKTVLVNFESYRSDLRPVVTQSFVLLWILLAGISFTVELGINSRRERRA